MNELSELEKLKANLSLAEEKREKAREELQEKETLVADYMRLVDQMKAERDAAYADLEYQKESMQDEYHPEYNEVINNCWERIKEAKEALEDAYEKLASAKQEKKQVRFVLDAAEELVASCKNDVTCLAAKCNN